MKFRSLISKSLVLAVVLASLSAIPAKAAAGGNLSVGPLAIHLTTPTIETTVGTQVSSTFTIDSGTAATTGEVETVTATISQPGVSSATPLLTTDGKARTAGADTSTVSTSGTVMTITVNQVAAFNADSMTSVVSGTVKFTPDALGQYVITLTTGATSHTATFTVNVNGAVSGGSYIPSFIVPTNGMYDATNGYQVAGGQAVLILNADTNTISAVTSTGVGSINSATPVDSSYAALASGVETLTSVTSSSFTIPARTAQVGGNFIKLVLSSAVVGAQTITIQPLNSNGSPGTAITKTVTWTAAGSTAAASISAYLVDTNTGVTSSAGLVDSTVPLSKDKASGDTSKSVGVYFKVKDANGNAVSGASVAIVVSGPGLISAGATGSLTTLTARSIRATSVTTDSTGYAYVGLQPDGSAGTGTVTATVGTVTASRSVTFTGSAATIAPKLGVTTFAVGVNGKNAGGGSAEDSSTAYAIKAKITDSAGNLVTSGSIYASSGTKSVVTVSGAAHTPVAGYVYILATGVSVGTATITFQNTDPAGTTAPTVTGTIAVEVSSGTAATVTMATDKTTYAPGEPGTLNITLTNAAGRPVADGTYTIFDALAPLTSNLYLQGNSSGANGAWASGAVSVTTYGGVASYDFYAPSVSGTLSFTATTIGASTVSSALATTVRGQAVTAAATLGSGAAGDNASLAYDAASAATDAANNAYEEAQNATQAASDALAAVKALAVQVKALIALVNKIKAKIGAYLTPRS